MRDFLRDHLKYKEIPSKPQEKYPYHPHSLDFAYFCRYGHQYLTYLPWEFFLEKVWLRNTLPTCSLDICPNFRSFFLLKASQSKKSCKTYSYIFFYQRKHQIFPLLKVLILLWNFDKRIIQGICEIKRKGEQKNSLIVFQKVFSWRIWMIKWIQNEAKLNLGTFYGQNLIG